MIKFYSNNTINKNWWHPIINREIDIVEESMNRAKVEISFKMKLSYSGAHGFMVIDFQSIMIFLNNSNTQSWKTSNQLCIDNMNSIDTISKDTYIYKEDTFCIKISYQM